MQWFIVNKYPEQPKHCGDFQQIILKCETLEDVEGLKRNPKYKVIIQGNSLGEVIQQFSLLQ